jgi:cytochrome c556
LEGLKKKEPGMNHKSVFVASTVALVAVAATAAPLSKPQALTVMKQRHDHMAALGDATKVIYTSLQSSSPDLNAIRQASAAIRQRAPKLVSWFSAGTGPDVGKTRAKAEIWQKQQDFVLKARDFAKAANQFDVAARRGDVGEIKTAFKALGGSCKACHDPYRAPEKD